MTGMTLNPSPISIGVPKSAIAFMNTMSAPARIVGVMSGTMTVATLRMPLQPRLSAASTSAASMLFIAPAA